MSALSSASTPVSTFTKTSRVETKTLRFAGNFYLHTEHKEGGDRQSFTRAVTHKTRMFGQSHWVNTIGMVRIPIPKQAGCPTKVEMITNPPAA